MESPSPLLVGPPSPELARHVQRAALAAADGRLASARQAIASALSASTEFAPALFVLACVALEEGKAREVESTLARLHAVASARMEPRLLERLLAQRQRKPGSNWSQSFVAAWAELGRPDFESSSWLVDATLEAQDTAEVRQEHWPDSGSSTGQLLLTLAARPLGGERVRWLLRQVPTLEEVGLFIAASNVLRHESLPAEFRALAAPVLRERLSELARMHPRSMHLQLALLLADTREDAPLSPRELTALEALSQLPVWRETSLSDTFLVARHSLREAGLPGAGRGALSVARLSIADEGGRVLRARAKATRSALAPGARHPLGRIFMRIGARMAEHSTLLERTLGLLMLRRGAEDMQDSGEMARVDMQLDALYAAQAAWRRAAVDRWPLHSLLEKVLEARARDEMALLRTL